MKALLYSWNILLYHPGIITHLSIHPEEQLCFIFQFLRQQPILYSIKVKYLRSHIYIKNCTWNTSKIFPLLLSNLSYNFKKLRKNRLITCSLSSRRLSIYPYTSCTILHILHPFTDLRLSKWVKTKVPKEQRSLDL